VHRPLSVLAAAAGIAVTLTAAAIGLALLGAPFGPDATAPLPAPAAATPSPTARSPLESAMDTASTPAPPPAPASIPAPPRGLPAIDRPDVVPRLQAALDAGRARLAAPGIAASVLFPDGRQWTGTSGVADLASGRALTPQTPFAIASVSKTFLAAEILLLVDEGRLALADRVASLLPGTLVGDAPIDARITIRMLLDHTSGLRDYLVSAALDRAVRADPTAVWTPERALSFAGRPVAPPGKGYHYANTNYVLLGLVAESVSGRTLAEEYRARFFRPFGLSSASYQGAEPPRTQLPTAYRYSSGRLDATPVDVTDGSEIRPFTSITTATGAAGSVAASAPDLARWAWALYDGVVLPPGLTGLMIDDAEATRQLDPSWPYGLGVQVLKVDGRTTYGHSGRLVGARSVIRWFPAEEVAIAIVTNQSRFDLTGLLVDLLGIVAPRHVVAGPLP
jgi:D-alanyl-D-alanine carboxypeptidase